MPLQVVGSNESFATAGVRTNERPLCRRGQSAEGAQVLKGAYV